jgi:hypothetical protein
MSQVAYFRKVHEEQLYFCAPDETIGSGTPKEERHRYYRSRTDEGLFARSLKELRTARA